MPGARLNIALAPSRLHRHLLCIAHLVLLAAVLLLAVPVVGKVLLVAALLANALFMRRAMIRQQDISHISLEQEQLNALWRGRWQPVEHLVPVFVSTWVTIITLRINGSRYTLPLWRDSAEVEAVRQLRVWLLCGQWQQDGKNKSP